MSFPIHPVFGKFFDLDAVLNMWFNKTTMKSIDTGGQNMINCKSGSPFSVLRSPFSVLRSPFSVLLYN